MNPASVYRGTLSRGYSEFIDGDSPPTSPTAPPPFKKRKVVQVIESQSDSDYEEEEIDDTPVAPLISGIQLGSSLPPGSIASQPPPSEEYAYEELTDLPDGIEDDLFPETDPKAATFKRFNPTSSSTPVSNTSSPEGLLLRPSDLVLTPNSSTASPLNSNTTSPTVTIAPPTLSTTNIIQTQPPPLSNLSTTTINPTPPATSTSPPKQAPTSD